jgi:putative ABC transport system permease protein
MRLSNIAHLYLVRVKARVVLIQELFAVLGIAVGIALLFASQVASTSLDGSIDQLTEGVIGQAKYQLKARGPSGFSESLLAEVRHLPAVQAATPILEQDATVIGPDGSQPVDLLATDPSDVHLTGRLLRHFSSSQLTHRRVLAIPAPIAAKVGTGPLEVVKLRIGARTVSALVGLELSARSVGALVQQPIVLAPIAYAQQLAGLQGRLTRVLVQPRPGMGGAAHAALMKLAADRINVEPADYEATLFSQAASPVEQSTSTFAAICALVGFMFAYCSMLLTADNRRRLIRELRRGGATRGETVKTLLFDALVIAAIASLLGLALGDALSLVAFSSPPGFLSFAFPIGSQRIIDWKSILIAVGAGTLAACIGVLTPAYKIWLPSRRTGHGDAGERKAMSALNAGLLAGGCASVAITAIIMLKAPQSAIVGLAMLILALLLLLAPVLDLLLQGLSRLQRSFGLGATVLAVVELRSPRVRLRSLAVAATAGVAVFGSVTIQGSHANLQNGLDRLFHEVSGITDLWVVPREEQDLLSTTAFRGVPASVLQGIPGMRAVGVYRAGFLEYGGRRVWVLAPPSTAPAPVPPSQVVAGDLAVARARLRAGGWAVVSKTLAIQHHLSIGDRFALPSTRETYFRVAALITNMGWPPGAIIINERDYVNAWESSDPSAYTVALDSGASGLAVSRAIRRALGPATGLAVETAVQRERNQRAASRQGLGRLTQIAGLVLIAGVLATAMVMGAMIWQRRRRFARMKVQGYGRRMLWQALLCESALLIGAGCLLGAVLGIYGQLLLSHSLVVVTGFPVVISANVPIAVTSFMTVTVVAAGCIAVPGYGAASVDPYPWSET